MQQYSQLRRHRFARLLFCCHSPPLQINIFLFKILEILITLRNSDHVLPSGGAQLAKSLAVSKLATCTMYNTQCTIHNAQCTMNNVQYTIHSAQYRCYCYTSKKITARCVRELNKYTINIQLEQYFSSSPQTIKWNSSSLSLSFQARS